MLNTAISLLLRIVGAIANSVQWKAFFVVWMSESWPYSPKCDHFLSFVSNQSTISHTLYLKFLIHAMKSCIDIWLGFLVIFFSFRSEILSIIILRTWTISTVDLPKQNGEGCLFEYSCENKWKTNTIVSFYTQNRFIFEDRIPQRG